MKIVYFGDFKLHYDTERYVAYGLRELGHEVVCMEQKELIIKNAKACARDVLLMKTDLVLFSKGKPYGDANEFIEEIKKNGIKTVTWLFDLYFGLPGNRELRLKNKVAPLNADIVFSTDGGHQDEFALFGIHHKLLRQGIHKPESVLLDLPKVNDVIFVGSDFFTTRTKLLSNLMGKYGDRFKRFGTPNTTVRGLALNELYGSTKVVVGDSQPSPQYWSNRIYETLGRGGFLIHPMVEGLDKEFEIGKHLITYTYGDFDDLCSKIDYYLEHDEEREKIRRAGFEYCKENYTYTKRCQKLLEQI